MKQGRPSPRRTQRLSLLYKNPKRSEGCEKESIRDNTNACHGIISSRTCALITAGKRRNAVLYGGAECCLERTITARTKNRTAAGTSLEAAFSRERFSAIMQNGAFLSELFLWTNYSGTMVRIPYAQKPRRFYENSLAKKFYTRAASAGIFYTIIVNVVHIERWEHMNKVVTSKDEILRHSGN